MSRRQRTPLTPAFQNRTKKPLITNDQFPLLEYPELAQCLQECDFDVSEELVSRPTAPFLQNLFQQMLDTFLGYTPEAHTSVMSGGNEKNAAGAEGQSTDADFDDTSQSAHRLVFFRAVKKFLRICGINDFWCFDLTRPDPLRTQRLLSAVINFARFREENLHVCETFARETEGSTKGFVSDQNDNKVLSQKVKKLSERLQQDMQRSSEASSTQLLKYNTKVEQELIKLQKSQEVFKKEHASYKNRKMSFLNQLESHHFSLSEVEREVMRLQVYASIDPVALRQIMATNNEKIQSLEGQEQQKEELVRNYTTTGKSIQAAENELRTFITIVQEVLIDVKAFDKVNADFTRQCEETKERQGLVEQLVISVERLSKQVQRATERVTKVLEDTKEQEHTKKEQYDAIDQQFAEFYREKNSKEVELGRIKESNMELQQEIERQRHEIELERRQGEAAMTKLTVYVRKYMQDLKRHTNVFDQGPQ